MEYKGTFDPYHEQGMGGFCATFHDDRGKHTVEGCEHEQWSLKWLIWFTEMLHAKQIIDHAIIFDPKGEEFYSGPLTPTKTNSKRNALTAENRDKFFNECRMLDIYFEELGFDKSVQIFHRKYTGTLTTNYVVKALNKETTNG